MLVALIGLGLRLWHLDKVPLAFYHDEIDHVFAGEALARYGTDITGQWQPWQLKPLRTLNFTAELPALFHALAFLVVLAGATSATIAGHLPNALFGIATAGLAGWLAYFLLRRRAPALFTGLVVLLNPWHIHISRMVYEATISVFFQLTFVTTVMIIISERTKQTKLKLGLVLALALSFFGAFFTYHGAKFSMLALGVVAIGLSLYSIKEKSWKWLVTAVLVLLIATHFIQTVWLNQSGAFGQRGSELISNNAYLEQLVNDQRQLAIQLPLTQLFVNKGTLLGGELIKRYASVFDLRRLFVTGYESGFQFSLIVHGFFYLSSLALIPLGVVWLWRYHRRWGLALIAFLIVSPVTSVITIGYQSIFRSALTYILLLMFAGFGATSVWDFLEQKKIAWLKLALPLLLMAESIWFGYAYFSRYPILTADNHYFSDRLVTGYLNRLEQPAFLITEMNPYTKARSYLTYTGEMANLTEAERSQFNDPDTPTLTLDQLTITTTCPDLHQHPDATWVIDQGKYESCGYQAYIATASATLMTSTTWLPEKALGSPIDSHSYFIVLNDPVCPDDNLRDYIYANEFASFDTVGLTTPDFCQTWMMKHRPANGP